MHGESRFDIHERRIPAVVIVDAEFISADAMSATMLVWSDEEHQGPTVAPGERRLTIDLPTGDHLLSLLTLSTVHCETTTTIYCETLW